MSEVTKQDLLDMEERILGGVLRYMGTRFDEVNGRLDRAAATIQLQAKQIAGGTKAIAGFSE